MAISYQSVAQECITLYAGKSLKVGAPCLISSNDTANNCDDCDKFCGIVESVRGNLCSVIVKGFVTVPYSGITPTVGWQLLAATDMNSVQCEQGGNSYLITNVNTTDKTITFLL